MIESHWDSEGLSLIRFTARTSSAFWQRFSAVYAEYGLQMTLCAQAKESTGSDQEHRPSEGERALEITRNITLNLGQEGIKLKGMQRNQRLWLFWEHSIETT